MKLTLISDGMSAVLWVLFVGFIRAQFPNHPIGSIGYDKLYRSAVVAYNQERWFECASLMRQAIDERRIYREKLIECRLHCQSVQMMSDITPDNFMDALYVDLARKKSECIGDCERSKFDGQLDIIYDAEVEDGLDSLRSYDYLQICAFKSELWETAMSSAYTFLSAYPNHNYMQDNVKFYGSLPEAMPSYFVDLEAKQYQELYRHGIDAYSEEDWLTSIQYIEDSLPEYYKEHRDCIALCDAPYSPSAFQELYKAIMDSSSYNRRKMLLEHWLSLLNCRKGCSDKLDIAAGTREPMDDYLINHYSYLQFAYFKLGNIKKAAECTATFLLFKPFDETMIYNKEFYSKETDVEPSDFTPRQEAKEFFEERSRDEQLLKVVKEKLSSTRIDRGTVGSTLEPAVFGPRDEPFLRELRAVLSKDNLHIFAENDDLNGEHRVVIDNFLSTDQCGQLMELAKTGAKQGDGYSGAESRTSPHTSHEKFEGLTVVRAAELARDGMISIEQARSYLHFSEKMRAFIEKYFNLQVPLMFQYTHLVCRSALHDHDQTSRKDFSHPVHSDNCHIQPDGSCPKQPPAYIYRDITGLVYLNDEFEGGDFFFAFRNQSVQQTVRPKCGRLVSFESSDYHGVLPVTGGRRCALAIWYTLNPNHQELSHAEAEMLLRSLEMGTSSRLTNSASLEALVNEKGYEILLTERELNGPERFAADNILTEEQCQLLIKLANGIGVAGDGYQSRSSPHTQHELFTGVSMSLAAERAATYSLDADALAQYLEASEAAIQLVNEYFNKQLYFAYTHLVCRAAINENIDRSDLSHPIHSDNCILQPDNTCKRERPAYTERDYSAILYLNSNFRGGDFFFAHQNMTVQSSVRPKCGRLVGFNSSNYHGVRAILSGQRCAVALWFTLDPRYREEARDKAQKVLTQLKSRAFGPGQHPHVEL